jgi:pyruvate dehydrogenase E2 component (dihydrolipoamide acetyltransferase)
LGEGVHEGELVKWKVAVGDSVKFDQPLCEIMTDKATVEIPSAFQGKVQEVHAKEGETVHVGQLLLSFEGAGAQAGASTATAPAPSAPAPAAHAAPKAPAPQISTPARAPAPAMGGTTSTMMAVSAVNTDVATRPLAAPSVRRQAQEKGVDLGRVQGSGPNGRIMREDLERAITSGGTVAAGSPTFAYAPARRGGPAATEERIAIRGLRKKISEKMRLSKDRAAHFTYAEECDATELVKLRAAAKEIGAKQGVKVTYLPFIMKAMVSALRKDARFAMMNSNVDDNANEIIVKHSFNIGLSIQTDDGLTAPVVKAVETKSVLEIAREIEDLVTRARAKKLTAEDFQGGTITLTNAGSIGGLFATPIINYPEVAILGFNKIARKPVVMNVGGKEEIAIRDWTIFSISLDHRVIDGAIAAEFMKTFISYVENPTLMLMDSF